MASPSPFRGVRKVIAARMMASLQSTAQLTYHGDADVTALMQQRRRWKEQGETVSLEVCVIFSMVKALKALPDINGVAGESSVTQSEAVDLSIAISTEAGLMTPVLKDIGGETLGTLSDRRRDLIERARAGKLSVSEMKGGSITLSNLGHTRVRYFTPILNAGQIALVGLGRLEETVQLDAAGQLVRRQVLPVSLTADHRVVDGEPAGQFLEAVCGGLEAFDASA